ncbi:MAG: type II secretion system minor pseudopilin GspJ [Psychrobacter alimentarius]
MKHQHGFTLLELMVAMAIFAMLAVAGWQVFDSVNRARERAQFHADNLAVLQYAYLQLQQDMSQIIPYQALDAQSDNIANNSLNADSQANEKAPEPFMSLDGEHVSFVRYADPDPRYQSSASIQHVEYVFVDERLIRRQYTSLGGERDSISLDSVLLEGVTDGRWQAYVPELSTKFPNENNSNSRVNSSATQINTDGSAKSELPLLPKGTAVSFTYQDMPITWQWALAPQPIPRSYKSASNNQNPSNDQNLPDDQNNNSDRTGNDAQSGSNDGVENSD